MARKRSRKAVAKTTGKTGNKTRATSAASPRKEPSIARSGFSLLDIELERALVTGENRGLLEDYFGPEQYRELSDLAKDASKRSVRGGARVLILPGIMGSTLGRKVLGINNVLWLDPIEIALGRVTALKLDASPSKYRALGVILFAYLRLKLRLRAAGFDADFYPFDWRLDLPTLGKQLAEAIQSAPFSQVNIVAHSMGGLVARAAVKYAGAKISRVIMLGTPNYGSYAPAQVVRATYDVVQKIAGLDPFHKVEDLCAQVFNTFPGLYQMLPAPEKLSGVDLYDPSVWPKTGPQPRAELLAAAKGAKTNLAAADERFFLIAGVNKDTVTGLTLRDGEFAYELSPAGDGTVPLDLALLSGIPPKQIYYIEEGHGSLPNNANVGKAVQDLLARGSTSVLSNDAPPLKRATRVVSEQEMAMKARTAVKPGQLGSSDFRQLLEAVASPSSSDGAALGPAGQLPSIENAGGAASSSALQQQFQSLVIGRRRQQRIELTLARGSITEVESPAYVLGMFRNVAPSGAANAIDQRLDGAIAEFTARRMFSGNVGEVFTIPTRRSSVHADLVLFAGLGSFDRFNSDVQQLVAENVTRVLVRSGVEEFATVLIGAGSGQSVAAVVQNLVVGFFRALRDSDRKHRFRGITLCESSPDRYNEMKAELFRLAGTELFDQMEVTLDEIEVPSPPPAMASRVLRPGEEPAYIMVRQEGSSRDVTHFRTSLLGAGMKAAVVTAVRDVRTADLNTILSSLDEAVTKGAAGTELKQIGERIARIMLPAEVCTVLESLKERHLVLVHDAPASRIPWEVMTLNEWSPAVYAGMSRRYLAENLPIVSWLEQRRSEQSLKLLLIVNPTQDLPGAEKEGDRILKLASSAAGISITELRGERATKAGVLSAIRSGTHDVVHYAGHAFFDEAAPARSGLLCAEKEILSGADLLGISNLPFLVFFNACEAGRVRDERAPKKQSPTASTVVRQSYGVAEALMRGGIANFLSTYWPVNDDAAMAFAETFYKSVLAGDTIGTALLGGRKSVEKLKSPDWADYILYGSYDFVLKQRRG